MNIDAHWQAFYDALRAGLDADGLTTTTITAVHSQDTTAADTALEPPYVTYSVEAVAPLGTVGGGPNKVLADTWRVTARTRDLADVLAIGTAVTDKWELEDIATTTDGYVTTALTMAGLQTVWEPDSKLHALHLRVVWERSK